MTNATLLRLPLALTLFAGPASAQNLIGYDGTGLLRTEFNGGPAACGYPAGPLVGAFPIGPAPCPVPVPIPPPPFFPLGDVAYDSVADAVYVSDGFLVAAYTAAGAFLGSGLSPLPVSGMGFDPGAGILWCTDGAALAYGLAAVPPGLCGGPVPLIVPPFPIPGPGPFTDVDWEPGTGSLFATSLPGLITSFLPGGLPGPFGIFPSSGLAIPPGAPLVGLAVDDAVPPGLPFLYVTDGFMVEAILPGGAPAPPTFSFPFPFFPSPGPTHGLAFAPHAVAYGAGVDPDGLAAPVSAAVGAATTPSATFAHLLTSAVPGGLAVLVVGTLAACPALPLLGVPLYFLPIGPTPVVATVPVGLGGAVLLPTALPPGLPPGVVLFDQWFIVKPAGPSLLQASNGLSFRVSLP